MSVLRFEPPASSPLAQGDKPERLLARSYYDDLRAELDTYWDTMRQFHAMEPDVVMLHLSAFSARAGEIRANLHRSSAQQATKLRTSEIDPFLEECDRQFKLHSRVQAIRELDWKMTGGQV